MAENSGENSSGNIVVGSVPIKRNFFSKNRKVLLLSGCTLIVAVVVAVVAVSFFSHKKPVNTKNEKTINFSTVKQLVVSNNCSAQAQQSIGLEQPSTNQVDASISLLSYRSGCLIQEGHYKQANADLEELKNYYSLKHDTDSINLVNDQIAADNYAMAHP